MAFIGFHQILGRPKFFLRPYLAKKPGPENLVDFLISTVWHYEANTIWISVVVTIHLEESLASGRTNAPWCNVQDLHSWPCRARISKISNRFPIQKYKKLQVPSVRTCVFLKQLFVECKRLRTQKSHETCAKKTLFLHAAFCKVAARE